MRFGCCAPLELLAQIADCGFDYLEWWVTALVELDDQGFREAVRNVEASAIRVEACCVFFPGSMPLTGPRAEPAAIRAHIAKACQRLGALGVRIAVVGSGKARTVPEGWDLAAGLDQFAEVLRRIGDEGGRHGITAVIEPLNRRESNIVNSVGEALALCRRVDHPQVKVLADFYHMAVEGETMDGVLAAGADLRHCHLASPHGRVHPQHPDEADYGDFLGALRRIDYRERLSLEVFSADYAADVPKAAAALGMLRRLVADGSRSGV